MEQKSKVQPSLIPIKDSDDTIMVGRGTPRGVADGGE